MPDQTLADMFERRKASLKNERESFLPHWKQLSDFVQPRKGRFFKSDHNRGDDRWNRIINNKATTALRVARAGLLAGVMSPSQQSFAYSTPDPDLNRYFPVKIWLSKVAQINQMIFNDSNLYTMAPAMLGELLLFGNGCMTHVDDFQSVARFYTHTIGSWMAGQNEKFIVDTIIREYDMQCSQMVGRYGYDNCSQSVKTAYDRGNYDAWYPVTHIIAPNKLYDPGKKLSKNKLFGSTYYEPGECKGDKFLGQEGFDYFPGYVPRWDVTGEDVYATDCPGMTALGDTVGLQHQEREKAKGIAKMVSPPLKGPASLRNAQVSARPGDLTIYDADASKEGLSPIYTVNPQLQEMRIDMKAAEDRIDDAFFAKLFKAISDMEGIQPRNQLELKQRDQERLLELGDPLQRLYGEFLDQLHDNVIDRGFKVGIYPPAPPELADMQIKPKYIGPLAQAQRTMQAQAIERTATFVTGLAQMNPQAGAKLNTDAMTELYADIVGADPTIIVPDEQLAQQREAAAKAQAGQQTVAAAGQLAEAADKGSRAVKQISEAPTSGAPQGGPSVLSGLMQAIQQRQQPNAFQAPPQR